MLRRLFTVLSALSLLLGVAVVVLWAMSQRESYGVIFYNGATVDYAAASRLHHVVFGTQPRRPHKRKELVAGGHAALCGVPAPAGSVGPPRRVCGRLCRTAGPLGRAAPPPA